MKKIFYILASAIVALGAVACDNQDFDNIAPEANGEGLTISAVVDETRVAFEGMTAKSWEKGDFVTIGGYKFDYVPDEKVFRCTAAGVEELVGQTLGATANELKPADGIKGSTFVSIEDKKIEDGVSFTFKLNSALLKYTTSAAVTFKGASVNSKDVTAKTGTDLYVAVNAGAADFSYWVDGIQCKVLDKNSGITFEAGNIYNLGELTEPVVLVPNANWKTAGNFVAYFCNGTSPAKAVDMVAQADGTYLALLPVGNFKNVIFCRMNDTKAASFAWDKVWDQTADLNIPTAGSDRYFWLWKESWKDGFWKAKDWNFNIGTYHALTISSDWASAQADYSAWTWGKADAWGVIKETSPRGEIIIFDMKGNSNVIFLRSKPGSKNTWNNEWNRIQTTINNTNRNFVVSGWSSGSWKKL
ncbi:MAG: hypothetical protein J6U53_04275 [Tidjanibacter sp.]|nr:hypothetical protein [Tidjanibacter sp.]